jgi:regulator of protease activity HflC (stomatin/prohibitin superfamily)
VVVGYVPNGSQDNTWTDGHGVEEYRLLSGDGNEMVSINLQVEYCIRDLASYLRNSASADSLLSASAYEIVTARTIATDMDALLSSDRVVFSETFREELEARITCYNTGIEVTNVVLESIHPPVEVADVYQQVITAGIHAKQLILETERKAIADVTAAQQQAYAAKSVASTSYYQAVATAKGEVQAFMAGVEANKAYPEAYTFYKYISALTEAYKKGVLIVVGDGVDSGKLVIGDLSRPVADNYGLEDEVEEEYFE